MEDMPHTLARGDELPAAWLNRILSALRSRELRAGPGIRLTRTPSGTTVSAAPGVRDVSAAGVFPAVVQSGGHAGGMIRCRAYPSGLDRAPGKFVDVAVTDGASLSAPEVGTVLLVHPVPGAVYEVAEPAAPADPTPAAEPAQAPDAESEEE